MPALSETVFLKQGMGADKDACQSPVQIAVDGSSSL